jgi:hypothetical protein
LSSCLLMRAFLGQPWVRMGWLWRCGQSAVGASPVTWFQVVNRVVISWRYWRPTKTVGGQLVTAAPRSRSPARGGPGIRSAAVLRGRGLCPDDPHLAAPEDHRALEKLTSHGFGRSPGYSGLPAMMRTLPTGVEPQRFLCLPGRVRGGNAVASRPGRPLLRLAVVVAVPAHVPAPVPEGRDAPLPPLATTRSWPARTRGSFPSRNWTRLPASPGAARLVRRTAGAGRGRGGGRAAGAAPTGT